MRMEQPLGNLTAGLAEAVLELSQLRRITFKGMARYNKEQWYGVITRP
jgi:hypothetical protein